MTSEVAQRADLLVATDRVVITNHVGRAVSITGGISGGVVRHGLSQPGTENEHDATFGRARLMSGCVAVARCRDAAGGGVTSDLHTVGVGELVSDMGFTCSAFVPVLLRNGLLTPILRGTDPGPGAFTVRNQCRRVQFAAFVVKVAVSTQAVVLTIVLPVFDVSRSEFVGWTRWSDVICNRPGDQAVGTVVGLRRRGGGDCVSHGGVQRSSKVKDLLLVGHHVTVAVVHFSSSIQVDCVGGDEVGNLG